MPDLPEEIIRREQQRQKYMQGVVEKVAADIKLYSPDPTVQMYLAYKIGALILTGALETIDKQVFAIDMGLLKTEQVETLEPEHKCRCGRALSSDGLFMLCMGCYKVAHHCKCIPLSVQHTPIAG